MGIPTTPQDGVVCTGFAVNSAPHQTFISSRIGLKSVNTFRTDLGGKVSVVIVSARGYILYCQIQLNTIVILEGTALLALVFVASGLAFLAMGKRPE
jgi:hypothetical protein